jgi:phosphate transport system permease protein
MPVTGGVAAAVGIAAGVLFNVGGSITAILTTAAVIGLLVFIVGTWAASRALEGPRRSTDRFVQTLVYTAFLLAIIPLVVIVITAIIRGYGRFDADLFTTTLRGVIGEGGGAAHAIVGTLIITLITAVISAPIGLLTAIYLVEYGRGALARAITFLVDVMTGIPSIVAGLFAFALFRILSDGFNLPKTGFAGSIALSLLMIPVVVRACEEMLRLVPDRLRMSSYALGVPKWLTIMKVVLPTASAGLAAGITVAIARVIGETAPLLVTAGFTNNMNYNAFSGFMNTLPVYVFFQFTQPGVPPEFGRERAWAAALVLILIVMVLNLGARLIAYLFSPKTR